MSSNLFNLSDGRATEMTEVSYEQEADLQKILADNPNLLLRNSGSGEEEEGNLYLIQREQSVQSLSLDLLLVDQDAVPVLVEVKRRSDARIYREVAAQMIDYASRVSSWDVKDLKSQFEKNNPEERSFDDDFWKTVETNLKAEHIKLVFAADQIPDSLKIMIEFLERAMSDIEVYGVEIHQFMADDATLLATNCVGSTLAETRKAEPGSQDWDVQSFTSFLEDGRMEPAVSGLEAVLGLAEQIGLSTVFGHGTHPAAALRCNNFTVFRAGSDSAKPYIEIPCHKISTLLDMEEDRVREMFSDIPTKKDTPQYIYLDLSVMAESTAFSNFSKAVRTLTSEIESAQKHSLHRGKWNAEEFKVHLTQSNHCLFIPVLDAMLQAAEELGLTIAYGTGVQYPTVRIKCQKGMLLEIGCDTNAYIFLSISKLTGYFGWTESQVREFVPQLPCRKDPSYSVLYSNATEEDIPALTNLLRELYKKSES